jgi:hypothetical protein
MNTLSECTVHMIRLDASENDDNGNALLKTE